MSVRSDIELLQNYTIKIMYLTMFSNLLK